MTDDGRDYTQTLPDPDLDRDSVVHLTNFSYCNQRSKLPGYRPDRQGGWREFVINVTLNLKVRSSNQAQVNPVNCTGEEYFEQVETPPDVAIIVIL